MPASSTGARFCIGTRRLSARPDIELPPRRLARTLRVADQQKVEILRAIAREAKLIVMDEPTSALTLDEAQRLFDLVGRLQSAGTTIIYVTHFLAEALELADTVTVLRDGRLIRTSAATEETPERLVLAMLGHTMGVTFPDKTPPPPDAPVVLSVRNLSRPPYVNDISFELRAGEIVGLAGLLGSGRSEVARAIFAADRALSGSVEVAGAELRARSPRQAINHGVVMLPEDRKGQGLLMLRTLVENITLPHLADVSRAGVMESRVESRRAGELLSRLDVRTKSPRARVNTLSGGNQQKVLFAKWLFRRPARLHRRRAHPGRRRRRQARDLRAPPLSGRGGDRGAADLIRARGGARSCAPRSRHAGRADRGEVHGRDDERKCSAERRVRDAAGRGD